MQLVNKISMPTSVFVDAVHMASMPCEDNQEGHAAIKRITDWWNATVEPEFACAYGFALYVRFGEAWLSGNPEEHWVDATTWAKHAKPKAEATLLNGSFSFVFFKQTDEENAHSFLAKAVDGSHGFSGGKSAAETSGDAILTRYAHAALSLVPARFPEIWRIACAETEM
ncbi:hypothetical protein P5704_027790 (plasmid) [Pseudomonas sp. FeN3W]|nr:hypothetical protein P5704_027790 [Pseudomonas sp. FeN3W]